MKVQVIFLRILRSKDLIEVSLKVKKKKERFIHPTPICYWVTFGFSFPARCTPN